MTSNQLAQETSPYLLQHKDNPVHWHAWGPQALAMAAEQNKPILLSVGYSACHWCHVMAHESFENPSIAGLMNEHFITIKVDREERPDLDAIYQTALAMLGQQGGWPLTMFLTPRGEPFWGGTYFPPEPRYGRPGFPDVLRSVAEAFRAEPDKIAQNVTALLDGLKRQAHGGAQAEHMDLSLELLDSAARQLVQYVDADHGGLNGAPKFPQPFLFEFLWRGWLRTGDESLRESVQITLDHMCNGGIYDHLGGGFHRYSTDAEWLAPHFEKMLYDNAQLVDLLTLVWQQTRSPAYAARIGETIEWVLREMVAEHGMFAATLDADSEGEEGKFYVWSQDRIEALIVDQSDAGLFKQAYDCRPGGNWEGKIILNRNKAQPYSGESFETMLADCRAVLWRDRERRIRPARDDKVLADWNGMMIAAMAHAGFVFDMPRWIDAARTAFAGVQTQMSMGVRLGHSLRHGRLQHGAMIDDYANMARAALVLHQITGERGYLDQAEIWVDVAGKHYWDGDNGGYFMTADDARDIIIRTKPVMDAATPSGNGVMAKVLTSLFLMTGDDDYRRRAEASINAAANNFKSQFANMTTLLIAYEMLNTPVQIAVIGDPQDDETQELLRSAAEIGFPNGILSIIAPGTPLPDHHPAHGKSQVDGKATAYVCKAMTCSAPATTDDELRRLLLPGYS